MNARLILWLSGAVGILFAALIYFAALQVRGVLGGWVPFPLARLVIFFILFAVSLAEILVMTFALRKLWQTRIPKLIYVVNVLYVAFAAVYAAVFLVLVDDPNLGAVLASLSFVRWASDFWVR